MQFLEGAKKPFLLVDPRTKLLLLLGMGFSVFTLPYLWMELACFAIMSALLLLNRQVKTVVKFGLIFLAMLLLDLLIAPLISGGLLPLFLSLVKIARLILPILLASLFLMKTTSVSEFIVAFEKMHLSRKIIIPLSVMFRFIPTIMEEWHCIRDAMRFRGIGVSPVSVITKPMMTLEYVMVPLLMSTATIADELAAASLSRGLNGNTKRSCIADVRFRVQDYILVLLCAGAVVCGVVL